MTTQTFTFYLYQTPHGSQDDPSFSLTECSGMEEHGWHLMRTERFTLEMPEPQDVRKIKLRALELEEQELRAQFAASVTELQRQKNELLAIEMDPA